MEAYALFLVKKYVPIHSGLRHFMLTESYYLLLQGNTLQLQYLDFWGFMIPCPLWHHIMRLQNVDAYNLLPNKKTK